MISQQPTQTVTVNQDKLSTVVESTQRKLSDVGQRHVLKHQPTAVSLTGSPPPPSLQEIEPSSHSPDNFDSENEEVRKGMCLMRKIESMLENGINWSSLSIT